ncbi:MAG: alpha/beta hydrolase, partial [Lachnospiraceae bacterium]|nr:alpha/beta hydrolase [Lachnospiraceae bacterium]
MKVFLIILLILIGVVLVFYVGPTIVSFFLVFRRKEAADLSQEDMKGTPYEPYKNRIRDGIRFLRELPGEEVSIRSIDGLKLVGTYIDKGSDKTAILVHGFRSNAYNNFAVMGRVLYEEAGYNLLLIDQRASGRSEGKLSSSGLKERYDVRNWIRFLDRKESVKEILLCGVSMGATSIAFTSDRLRSRKVNGLILDCGYESPENQIIERGKEMHYPAEIMMPLAKVIAGLVLKEDLSENVLPHLKKSTLPALFIHGTRDRTVPFYEGENMYREYRGPKRKLFAEGADHAVAFYADYERGRTT